MNMLKLRGKIKKAIAGLLSVAMVLTSLTIPTTTVMAEEAAVNLISNGSFTEGVSDWTLESENWFVDGDYVLKDGTWNAGSDEDNHNAYIWYNGSNDWKTQGPGCIHKSIGSLGAGVYKMSAYVNTQFPLSVDLFVASSYENYTLDAEALAGTTAGDESYTKIEKEITIDSNMPAATAGVVLYLNDTDVSIAGGNIFIDEVSLVKISDIEAPETSLKDLSDLVNGSISVNSLTVNSIAENAGDDNAELYYTDESYSAYKTALEAAKTLIASADYAEVLDPAMTSDDDIVAAYNALYLAMSKLEVSPEPPAAQTLYFYYNHENLKEGEVLAANAWRGVVIDASADSFDIGWDNPFYVLTQIYPDWWELSLNDHIDGGFGIYVSDKSSEGTKLGEYDPELNNTELYAEISKDDNTEVAIKDGKAFVNETAKALTSQVAMYVYDAENIPTLYIWADGGEWDDKSYPLTYVDEEAGEVKELTAETDGGNHYYKFSDASEELGDNWYKLGFVADTEVSGKVFSLIGYSDAGYVWEPNTKFSYDGTADTVDASPMLEGKVYYKDGSFSESIDASLSMLRKLIDSAKEIDASGYTKESFDSMNEALSAAQTVADKYAEVLDPAMTSDDDIVAAYNALYLAMNNLEVLPEPPAAQTLYFYYNHENLKEGEVLAANAWRGVVIDASADSFDIGWDNPFYVLTQIYPDWWELSLNDHIAGGFSIYVSDKSSEGTKLGEYDPEYNNTELYAEISKDDNTEVAIKDSKVFVNETAKALTSQVTMYVYDAENIPTLYIWADGGEWDDKSYPLTYVDEEAGEVKELTAETDGGNHYYKFSDASEELGDNWYKLGFVADTEVSGKVFSLIGYSDAGYVWEPNTKFSYDGTADTVDASAMLEGKVYYKDGSFSASIDASLSMLRKLIDSAKEIEASGYTKESFDSMNEALSAAQTVADKYAEVSDEDSIATLGEDISQAYDNLKSAINALEKLFAADKVVHVYYHSQNDISGLFVRPWSSVADYVKQNIVSKVGDEHPDWYTFDLEMSKEAETVTDWPGFDLNVEAPNWDDSLTVEFTTYWNALAVASKNGDSVYIKDGEIYSSFDGKTNVTLAMLKELVESSKYYPEEDYTEESYAGYAKAIKDAKDLIDSEVSESSEEGRAAIEEAYNAIKEAMDGLVYKTVADINVKKVILNDDFILGADLSSYVSIRQSGVVFKADINNDGAAEALSDQEFFNYLKEGGTNWVRIRVWNDPYDSSGNGYGGGNNDINKAITLGKLAQKAGMKILIDFHYSDFWADPSKYKAPKAWAEYTNQEKADALYDFTYSCMEKLYNAGVSDVYMVQVGNESNHGLAGETDGDATILYGYGCEAVKDAAKALYKHDIDTAVHVTDVQNGGGTVTSSIDRQLRNKQYKSHKDGSLQYVDYDAIGVSYYPMYNHGTIPNLKNVIKILSDSYGPGGSSTRVFVAETSWARTWLDGDGFSNSGPSISGGQDVTSYSISVQGQADELRAVVDTVNSINSDINDLTGFGVFYWEPAWLAPYQACYDDYSYDADNFAKNQAAWEKFGSGWASKYSVEYDPTDAGLYYGGVGVDNMGWFNFDGTALPTAQAYKLIRSGASTGKTYVVAVEGNQKITLNVGVDSQIDDILPKTVVTYYNDGTKGSAAVTWNKEEKLKIDLDEVNVYEITGKSKVDGVTYPVKLTVEVVANNSIAALKNNDFEIIEDTTSNNIKFKNWDVYAVNEDGTYVTYISQTDGSDANRYFNWGTNNITINNENARGDAVNGHALNFWHAESPLDVHIYQKIGTAAANSEFIPGQYTFGGYLEGGSAGEYDKQYAVAYVYDSQEAFEADLVATKKDPVDHPLGTNAKRYKGSAKFAGWLSWQEAKVDSVQVNEGQFLVVGYEMNGSTAGAWGSVDDAYLYGSFNVNLGENTGNGKGQVTASKYVAGTYEKVKLTAKADKGYVLKSITVAGDGVTEDFFKPSFSDGKTAWKVEGKKAVYTATDADNENMATTIYFSMPEGDVTVTAEFADLFDGNVIDINDSAIQIKLNGKSAENQVFYANKKQIKPEVTLSYKGYVLTGSDISVKYGANKEPGKGTIELTGKGSRFTGSRTLEFTILEDSRKQLASVEFVTPDSDKKIKGYYYTGSEITFVDKSIDPDSIYAITVKDEDGNTVSANEYVLGYEKNVKVGTAKLFVNAKADSHYSGNFETKFKIERADLSKLIVPGDASARMVVNDTNRIADTAYVKDGVTPSVQVWYDGVVNLRKGKDYKVSYKNNKKISTEKNKATVVITGRGNYTGKAVLTYNIAPSDIADQNVLVQVNDVLEGASLNPRVTVMLRTSSRNKISTVNYKVAVYEIPAGLTTISENNLGEEVTRQKADANKEYAVKITGKSTFTGCVIQRLRVADKDHMVMDSSVYVGDVYYQAGAIQLSADGNGTLKVDSSEGKSVSVNSIKVMTKSGSISLSQDQFDIYLYKQKNKDNITASGRASLYIRVKDGVRAADGKLIAGDVVKVIKVKKLHLVSYAKYQKLVKEGNAMGSAAINHKSADDYSEITNETNLYDVMDEDTAYGREQYYTGYKKNPGYTGASKYSEGLKICMNGSNTSMPFIDYTLTYTNNVKPGVVSKDGSGITYGGDNKEDPVALNYVKGSGATANFSGINNYFGVVKFLDAFYIHPRTIDDLEVIPVSTVGYTGKTSYKETKYVKFIDPRYGVEDFMKPGVAYRLTVKNIKKVAGIESTNAPEATLVTKNGLIGTGDKNVIKWNFALAACKINESNVTVMPIKTQKYNGGMAVTPKVKVYVGKKALSEGKDYILEYSNNYERCSTTDSEGHIYENGPKVKIIGIGNYTGEIYRYFDIE